MENVRFFPGLAGLKFDVSCRYETTRALCAQFPADPDAPVDFQIAMDDGDIEAERKLLLSKKNPGERPEASSPRQLEALLLCRRLAECLPGRDRVLFHGSCLAYDGMGVLFTAKSGTGKSTHTRLWRETFGERVVMVNDDKPFLHITAEGVSAYGTPWQGKHRLGCNMSVPLKAICILCRGEENRIRRVSPREALPWLLQQTYSPEDREALVRTLALADRLSKQVAVYMLHCNMDPQAAMVARDGIFTEG